MYLLQNVDNGRSFSSRGELSVSDRFGRLSEARRRDQRDYSVSQTTTIFFKTGRLAHPDLLPAS